MTDPSDLMRKANDLKEQAKHEADGAVRDRLIRMAEDYIRLAEAESEKQAHPVDAAALGAVFRNDD